MVKLQVTGRRKVAKNIQSFGCVGCDYCDVNHRILRSVNCDCDCDCDYLSYCPSPTGTSIGTLSNVFSTTTNFYFVFGLEALVFTTHQCLWLIHNYLTYNYFHQYLRCFFFLFFKDFFFKFIIYFYSFI